MGFHGHSGHFFLILTYPARARGRDTLTKALTLRVRSPSSDDVGPPRGFATCPTPPRLAAWRCIAVCGDGRRDWLTVRERREPIAHRRFLTISIDDFGQTTGSTRFTEKRQNAI
jgi:hypothetical protein